jgi:hypothetical protein
MKFARDYFGEKYVKLALFANLTMNLSLVQVIRTYANSIESTCFIIALYYWMISSSEYKSEKFYFFDENPP